MGSIISRKYNLPMRPLTFSILSFLFFSGLLYAQALDPELEKKASELLHKMTIQEKIGQLSQVNGEYSNISSGMRAKVQKGEIGSILNEVDTKTLNELQRIAVEESRLGIPLIFARDVIHGFKTIFPIPLGQAASWNPDLVEKGARIAAIEASSVGLHWTFAPMIDISRDPRWGRIAESLGEDPYLTSQLGVAMVRGFQGESLADKGTIAACAKHFVGYGAAEGGRDYNIANIPENELYNNYFPPFKACVDAGVATFMPTFNELNGVPASGNAFLFRTVLREDWKFEGFVVSDWESVRQLVVHGVASDNKEAARQGISAGIDMEMASTTYSSHLLKLVEEGTVPESIIDEAVRNILRIKFQLGLFDNPYTNTSDFPPLVAEAHLAAAEEAAVQSCVLLKNERQVLPLQEKAIRKLAVIGPLADDPYEQLGTWIFDGNPGHSITPLSALRSTLKDIAEVHFVKALETSRSYSQSGFPEAAEAAKDADAIVLFLGEESILSGEAHCRADLGLPGAQLELIQAMAQTGKPVITVVMAGRPLALGQALEFSDALLFAWHPGTMGGPAIARLLLGKDAPSGKLPVTFPTSAGQIPMYYNHKNTGKPATEASFIHIDDIPVRAPQTSVGNTSYYLDAGYHPLFPFGYGLSYTRFEYTGLKAANPIVGRGDILQISVQLSNTGDYEAVEVAQLYIRDLVSSITRPVKELKSFQRVRLRPGESRTVTFSLPVEQLAYYYPGRGWEVEPGEFDIWVGGNSEAALKTTVEIR